MILYAEHFTQNIRCRAKMGQMEIYDRAVIHTVVQNQKAVSAFFTSEQILQFGFAERHSSL